MSTDVLEDICISLQDDLKEHINDEPFDMLEEFTDEEIAIEVISIACRLLHHPYCCGHIIHKKSDDIPKYSDYRYSVNNEYKGTLSVSNADCTGVSKTEYFPFFHDGDECLDGLTSLADMLNEAWYYCNKK